MGAHPPPLKPFSVPHHDRNVIYKVDLCLRWKRKASLVIKQKGERTCSWTASTLLHLLGNFFLKKRKTLRGQFHLGTLYWRLCSRSGSGFGKAIRILYSISHSRSYPCIAPQGNISRGLKPWNSVYLRCWTVRVCWHIGWDSIVCELPFFLRAFLCWEAVQSFSM